MTALILLLFLLTFSVYQNAGAGSFERARRNTAAAVGALFGQSRRNAALGLLALTLLTARVAQDMQLLHNAFAASAQDEIAWTASDEAL
jgi:hypothetical protein